MGDQLAPLAAVGPRKRRDSDAPVDRIRVGQDEERLVAVEHAVADAGLPRRDQTRRGLRLREVDQPALGGFLVAGGDEAKPAAGAFLDAGEPAAVLLFVDEDVVALGAAQPMAVDPERPVVLVDAHVEEERRVEPPDDAAAGLLDDIRKVLAGLPAANANGVVLRAAAVRTPGFEPMVRRMPRAAELEVRRAFGQLIAVEERRALAAVARPTTDQRLLAAFAIARQVGERPVRLRHAGIVLFDAPAHFGDQRLLQRRAGPEHRFGMAVLRLQIGPDVRIEQRRVAQDLLPSRVLQPGIVVGERDAVERLRERTSRREGRLAGRVLLRTVQDHRLFGTVSSIPALALFGLSIAFGYTAWAIFTAHYLWPELRRRPRLAALRPMLILHSFRFIGLAFLIRRRCCAGLAGRFSNSCRLWRFYCHGLGPACLDGAGEPGGNSVCPGVQRVGHRGSPPRVLSGNFPGARPRSAGRCLFHSHRGRTAPPHYARDRVLAPAAG